MLKSSVNFMIQNHSLNRLKAVHRDPKGIVRKYTQCERVYVSYIHKITNSFICYRIKYFKII